MKTLELKDIVGYLPYQLHGKHDEGHICVFSKKQLAEMDLKGYKPVLRPLSDLYKSIIHDSKEEIVILECAKIAMPDISLFHVKKDIADRLVAKSGSNEFYYNEIKGSFFRYFNDYDEAVNDQYRLFDYLNSRLIDYRGLIDAKKAVSVYDLPENPYENASPEAVRGENK